MSRMDRYAAEDAEKKRKEDRKAEKAAKKAAGRAGRSADSDAEKAAGRAGRSADSKDTKARSSGKDKGRVTPLGHIIALIGTLIMIISIAMIAALAVPGYAGIQSYVVVSGSMEPEIPVGSMVYAKETDPSTLQTGDIIVFYDTNGGDTPVTHRVVENDKEKKQLMTKGDANESQDLRPAIYNNVVGKVIMHLPHLGYIAAPFATLQGKIAMAMIVLAGFLLTEAGRHLRR